jgi:hypothetical protein
MLTMRVSHLLGLPVSLIHALTSHFDREEGVCMGMGMRRLVCHWVHLVGLPLPVIRRCRPPLAVVPLPIPHRLLLAPLHRVGGGCRRRGLLLVVVMVVVVAVVILSIPSSSLLLLLSAFSWLSSVVGGTVAVAVPVIVVRRAVAPGVHPASSCSQRWGRVLASRLLGVSPLFRGLLCHCKTVKTYN